MANIYDSPRVRQRMEKYGVVRDPESLDREDYKYMICRELEEAETDAIAARALERALARQAIAQRLEKKNALLKNGIKWQEPPKRWVIVHMKNASKYA